jgi:hypothetical protein
MEMQSREVQRKSAGYEPAPAPLRCQQQAALASEHRM